MRSRLVIVVLAGCGPSLAVGTLRVAPSAAPPAVAPCEPSPEPPPLDAGFAPTLSGGLSLIDARGDVRFSSTGPAIPAWSADGTQVALRDDAGVSVWRVADGALIDRLACPGPPIRVTGYAGSPDLRWIVLSGVQHTTRDDHVTCIFDRETRAARIVDGEVDRPVIQAGAVVGRDRAFDLESGAAVPLRRAATDAPPPGVDTEGAEGFAVSPDGRYAAGWTRFVIELESDRRDSATRATRRPQFLAVWDRSTGQRLWRDDTRCCWGWQFSADSRYLEALPGRASTELIRAASGEVLSFPYALMGLSRDSERAFVFRSSHVELWKVDPPGPALRQPRPRPPLVRSRDGVVTVAIDDQGQHEGIAIERGGRCFHVGVALSPTDELALSADGEELYVGVDGRGRPPGAVMDHGVIMPPALTSMFTLWRTATGQLAQAIAVRGGRSIYPMPATGQVGFAVQNGLEILDAHTGRSVMRARAPRASQSPFNAQGRSWPVRDPEGERADQLTGHVIALADGLHLIGRNNVHDSLLSIWDLTEPRRVVDLAGERHPAVRFPLELAPDEAHVAAGASSGEIGLWTRRGTPVPVQASHAGKVEALAFSQDGRWLASGGIDGVVLVIDTASGAALGRVALAADRPQFLWWSPDHQLRIHTARGFELTIALAN